ncbi:MAG: hydroxymethylbilane synthase [Candidatus Promineifilaceae bacterium]
MNAGVLPKPSVVIGSRASKLARRQAGCVAQRLRQAWPGLTCSIRLFVTAGDRTLERPLPEMGAKGVFTAELEQALRQGEIQLAVHSLKDLPVADSPGLTLGAIPERADARDVLVARHQWTLATLPAGATVGSSSPRRQAQLLAVRPDLIIRPIRGNVETRLAKVLAGEYDAAVLAAAGLLRLDLGDHIREWLPVEIMLPAPGQAALAVQCRAEDEATVALLAAIDDRAIRAAATAERAFLAALGGGCSAPVAAYAQPLGLGGDQNKASETTQPAASLEEEERDGLHLTGLVATPDGRRFIRLSATGRDPWQLGHDLARQALAQGAAGLLELAHRPLAGRRIVVTRAAHQAQELADQLAALGATPIVIPATCLRPPADPAPADRALQRLAEYDWIIFTSANAVAFFWQQLRERGLEAAALAGTRLAAVGPATAAALRERSLAPAFVPDEHIGTAVAAGLGNVAGRRILLPRAAQANRDLPAMLVTTGAVVDDVAVYQVEPAPMSAADLAPLAVGADAGLDAITFASGTAARAFAAALRQHGLASILEQTLIACIGPTTAAAVRELGLPLGLAAAEHTSAALVQALVHHFQSPPD